MKYFKWGFNSHELPLLAQEPREMPGLYSDEKKLVFGVPELKSFWYIYIYICSIRLKTRRKKLKYVDFVQVVPIYVVVCFSSVYRYAKENSGPLKPGVRTVEDTVRTVIGPVHDKFHDVPFQLLKFVDHKVSFSFLQFQIYFATGQLITTYITWFKCVYFSNIYIYSLLIFNWIWNEFSFLFNCFDILLMTSTLNILLDVSIYIIISSKYIYFRYFILKIKISYNYLSKIKDQTFNYKKYISLGTQNSFISVLWNCLPCTQLINKFFFIGISVIYFFLFFFFFFKLKHKSRSYRI